MHPSCFFDFNFNLLSTFDCLQMTLWSMARSPLMFGGDMRKLDDATYGLLTNPILLEINSFSSNNKEVSYFLDHCSLKMPQKEVKFSFSKIQIKPRKLCFLPPISSYDSNVVYR